MNIDLLVVEDEAESADLLSRMLGRVEPSFCTFNKIKVCQSARQAEALLESYRPKLIFLDIQLPDTNGLTLAGRIFTRFASEKPSIIFTTAHDNYAVSAFEVEATDYLLKPFTEERLLKAIQRALEYGAQSDLTLTENPLPVSTFSGVEFVLPSEIVWAEASGSHSVLHTTKKSMTVRKTLGKLEAELPPSFVRTHRSFLANIHHVERTGANDSGEATVFFKNGSVIPISRRFKSNLKQKQRSLVAEQ